MSTISGTQRAGTPPQADAPSGEPGAPVRIDPVRIDPVRIDPVRIDPVRIDPRGPQLGAALTSVVLAVVLLTAPHPGGVALLAVQAVLFALGAGLGVQRTPYAWLFKTVVRPRLGPPDELEDVAPPRFAQAVGLSFALVGLAGFLTGATGLGLAATGLALVAALLNAAFRFCLGCEMYLLIRRATAG